MFTLKGKRVLVLGLGLSGRSAAAFCAEHGARRVTVHDSREDADAAGLPASVEVLLGGELPDFKGFDILVPSPGIPPEKYAARARKLFLQVWGDIELAFRALDARGVTVVAITGTNGKSTTVKLVEAMLRAGGKRARAAGNIGAPALGLLAEKKLEVAVLEVSSFQLENVEAFRPHVAVLLNCTPDHLDRHGSFKNYLATKMKIFARQKKLDYAIVNADDPALEGVSERVRSIYRSFSTQGAEGAEASTAGEDEAREGFWSALFGRRVQMTVPLPSEMLYPSNLLAALLCAGTLGVHPVYATRALKNFEMLPHRMQCVSRAGGVTWLNDSKATNPAAARAALKAVQKARAEGERIWWIAGGRDKGAGFAELAAPEFTHIAKLFAIGESAAELERELGSYVEVEQCGTLEAACARARELASAGDTILLSPACASHDQFKNFEERGARFAELAK